MIAPAILQKYLIYQQTFLVEAQFFQKADGGGVVRQYKCFVAADADGSRNNTDACLDRFVAVAFSPEMLIHLVA